MSQLEVHVTAVIVIGQAIVQRCRLRRRITIGSAPAGRTHLHAGAGGGLAGRDRSVLLERRADGVWLRGIDGADQRIEHGARLELQLGPLARIEVHAVKPIRFRRLAWPRWSKAAWIASVALHGLLLSTLLIPPRSYGGSRAGDRSTRLLRVSLQMPGRSMPATPAWLHRRLAATGDHRGQKPTTPPRRRRDEGARQETMLGRLGLARAAGLYGLRGPKDNPDPHLARRLAEDAGRSAGVLGLLREDAVLPPVVAGRPEVRGSLDRETIQRIVRHHIKEVRGCCSRATTRAANLSGKVTIRFVIASTGRVVSSRVRGSTLDDRPVGQCIAKAVRRWTFPSCNCGGIVVVDYPFFLARHDR